MGQDDDSLARAAADGDGAAFAALVERHYDRVFRIGWRLLGSAAEAEDLAQDVCATLGRRMRSYRGEAAFTAWLTALTLNAARDAIRARGRRTARERAYAEAETLMREGASARAREIAWLRGAMAGLPDPLRETAVLVLDEGMSHAEAGAAMGVSAGTVSWRMSVLRKALRASAERVAPGEDVGT